MVVTRIAIPSTVNVTVLDAETAKPPANPTAKSSAPTMSRNMGDGF
jgi:hypothetical protein